MSSFCCFFCPIKSYEARTLDDLCPSCGRTYGFPLTEHPAQIGPYSQIERLARGFYGATYRAKIGNLGRRCVLKIVPKQVYQFFGKDFDKECHAHQDVAEGTQHVVPIHDMMDCVVNFGGTELECHVAELGYIDGDLLSEYLGDESYVNARMAAQIAIDLLTLRRELESKRKNHNDLHADNIIVEKVRHDALRADCIEPSIRAMAIDLGSVSDESQSSHRTGQTRLGDIHQIAQHIRGLTKRLLNDPDSTEDFDYRLATALQDIVYHLSPGVPEQRTSAADCIRSIQYSVRQVAAPWTDPLELDTFGASYNAQTLSAWYVPELLVDPDDYWLKKISTPGPQIITGMRGCGKTMLLRAVEFHARAARRPGEPDGANLKRIVDDPFVGLYVSANRLLDPNGIDKSDDKDELVRLYVAYGLAAVRAVEHLSYLDPDAVFPHAHKDIAEALDDLIQPSPDLSNAMSMLDLGHRLTRLEIEIGTRERQYHLRRHAAIAFPHLAQTVRSIATIWQSSKVLFLLDDVSTRYLSADRIGHVFSTVTVQDETCAFKITTEAQAIHLVLRSPGGIERAQVGRDYETFDLGADVYLRIKEKSSAGRMSFVEQILQRRAEKFAAHPQLPPKAILGDTSLESIARQIAHSFRNPQQRNSTTMKSIYHGVSALAGVCVGDIGDILSLYQSILESSDGKNFPVRPDVQNSCFLEFSSRRLYALHRHDRPLREVAQAFAAASNELLVNSGRSAEEKPRLRQYLSIYVNITTGDKIGQMDKLRALVDAGLFVFSGGTSSPRTKTHDSDPLQQFKLTYRKVYGLSNLIGLAERDRFELSGSQLEEWLDNPADGKSILLRNQVSSISEDDSSPYVDLADEVEPLPRTYQPGARFGSDTPTFQRQLLFPSDQSLRDPVPSLGTPPVNELYLEGIPQIRNVTLQDFAKQSVDTLVLGLGFEDRTVESIKRLIDTLHIGNAVAVHYEDKGKSEEILRLLNRANIPVSLLPYEKFDHSQMPDSGTVLFDVTGLAKPVIFYGIRGALRQNGKVCVAHTKAQRHYPKDEDIHEIMQADRDGDIYKLLERMDGVLMGEEAPYRLRPLLSLSADETRRRLLFAFSSPRHQRLLTLADRDYDRALIVVHNNQSPRTRLSKIVAEVAQKGIPDSQIEYIDSDSPAAVLQFLSEQYHQWYVLGGYNFEIGLTGSKLQAVACAAMSSTRKVSQCWYVAPHRFDAKKFTEGAGETTLFEIQSPAI